MIYVDNMFRRATVRYGTRNVTAIWCHMTADTKDELNTFAVDMLGLNPAWFQTCKTRCTSKADPECVHWHYDVTKAVRAEAVKAGAVEITIREMGAICANRRASRALINGVKRDVWGSWCPHGKRIIEPDPTDIEPDYPRGRPVRPWPCDVEGCTLEDLNKAMEAEAREKSPCWPTCPIGCCS